MYKLAAFIYIAALMVSPAAMGVPTGAAVRSPESGLAAEDTVTMPEVDLQALQRASDRLTRDLDAQLNALRAGAERRVQSELDSVRRELAEAKALTEALRQQLASVQRELEPKLNVCIADRDAVRREQSNLVQQFEELKAQLSEAEGMANERQGLVRSLTVARHDADKSKAGAKAAARARDDLTLELERMRTEARSVEAERDAALRAKDQVVAELSAIRLERDQGAIEERGGASGRSIVINRQWQQVATSSAGPRADLGCVAPFRRPDDFFAALPLPLEGELSAARNEIRHLRSRLEQAETAGPREAELRAELERARRQVETERAALQKAKRERNAAVAQAKGARAALQSANAAADTEGANGGTQARAFPARNMGVPTTRPPSGSAPPRTR